MATMQSKQGNIPAERAVALSLAMLALVVAHVGRPPRNYSSVSTEQLVREEPCRRRRDGLPLWLLAVLALTVLVVGAAIAGRWMPRDGGVATIDDLAAELSAPGHDWRSPARRALVDELQSRGATELRGAAIRMANNPHSVSSAVVLFGVLAEKAGPSDFDDIAKQVLPMLEAEDPHVRCLALAAFGLCCDHDDGRVVPEAVWQVVREFLVSPDPTLRGSVVATLGCFGNRVAPLRDALVELVRREPEEGIRFSAVRALINVRPLNAELQLLRRELLDDPDSQLRFLAANWYLRHPEGGAGAIPRLLSIEADASETDARREAFSALACLLTDREQAETLVRKALALQPESWRAEAWCRDLGRLAHVVRDSPVLLQAATALRAKVAEGGLRVSELAALARVVAAHRDLALEATEFAALQQVLVTLLERVHSRRPDAIPRGGEREAVEVLVEFAVRKERGVQPSDLRLVLDACSLAGRWRMREWAREQRQRLPE